MSSKKEDLVKNNSTEKEKQITNSEILNIARLSISSVRNLVWIFLGIIGLLITSLSWYGYSSIKDIKEKVKNVSAVSDSVEIQYENIVSVYDLINIKYKKIKYLEKALVESNESVLTKFSDDKNDLIKRFKEDIDSLNHRIVNIDSSINSLAKIFSKTATRYQSILSSREVAFLFILSKSLYEITGLPANSAGLYYYDLGKIFYNIGEYKIAVEYLNNSLKIETQLSKAAKDEIKGVIKKCKDGIEERKKILSREVRSAKSINEQIQINNKLSTAIINVLFDRGILNQNIADEIMYRAALEDD